MSERKSWIEVGLMPLVVAVVGIVGAHLITRQQEENARTLSDAQLSSARELAAADRQVKILEIFAEKVTSPDQGERMLALRLLRSVDGDLAQKLATAVLEGEPVESEVRKVADEIAQEGAARARLLPRIYVHIRSEANRLAARSVGEDLRVQGYVVPGVERLVGTGPRYSQLRYFRQTDKQEAIKIVDLLRTLGVTVDLQYIQGYEESDAVRPRHYELWFAAGEPDTSAVR